MIHTVTVALPAAEILARAKRFFAERVPNASAFVEKEGPEYVVLRGQGGEEVAIHARSLEAAGKPDVSQVRASTPLFDQAVDRFLSTLPRESSVTVT
jgi:hypothetical protein